jgi:hypothetical protein
LARYTCIILSTLDENEKPVTKLSPFVTELTIKGMVGEVQSVKKMKNETLLVECTATTTIPCITISFEIWRN